MGRDDTSVLSKVRRSQNAASLLLTTEALVAERTAGAQTRRHGAD